MRTRLSLVVILLLTHATAFARIQAGIELHRGEEGSVWKGQAVPLYLDLWSDGFSFSGQSFQLPEVTGGYLVRGEGSTTNLAESRGQESWQGLRYNIKFYPQHTGKIIINSFKVSFQVKAGYNQPAQAFEFNTDPLEIDVRLPPGASADALLVSSDSWSMDYRWSPRPGPEGSVEIKVGDALVLEVERRAGDVPGMMFEPLAAPAIDGLGVYADKPKLRDTTNRGQMSSQRLDRITYVAESEGDYRLEKRVFQSWNPSTEQLSEKRIPALDLVVSANPAYADAGRVTGAESGGESSWSLRAVPWWLAPAGIVLLFVAWRGLPVLRRELRQALSARREAYAASEKGRFEVLMKACDANDAGVAYAAASQWLRAAGRGSTTLLHLARDAGSRQAAVVTELEQAVFSASPWQGGELAAFLRALRRSWREQGDDVSVLPPLNPG